MEEQEEESNELVSSSRVRKRKTGDDDGREELEVFEMVPPSQKKALKARKDIECVDDDEKRSTLNSSALDRILEIIPDCDREHARSICFRFGVKFNEAVDEDNNLQKILTHLLEEGYKKNSSKHNPVQLHLQEVITANSNTAAAIGAVGKKYSRDFYSIHGELTNDYKVEVVSLMTAAFPECPKDHIAALLKQYNLHFAPCFQMICDKTAEKLMKKKGYRKVAELMPEVMA